MEQEFEKYYQDRIIKIIQHVNNGDYMIKNIIKDC